MRTFLITFQIEDSERVTSLITHIKKMGTWARITKTTWCVKVEHKITSEIRDALTSRIGLQNEDRLMIVNITDSAWASYNLPKEVAGWLKEK